MNRQSARKRNLSLQDISADSESSPQSAMLQKKKTLDRPVLATQDSRAFEVLPKMTDQQSQEEITLFGAMSSNRRSKHGRSSRPLLSPFRLHDKTKTDEKQAKERSEVPPSKFPNFFENLNADLVDNFQSGPIASNEYATTGQPEVNEELPANTEIKKPLHQHRASEGMSSRNMPATRSDHKSIGLN